MPPYGPSNNGKIVLQIEFRLSLTCINLVEAETFLERQGLLEFKQARTSLTYILPSVYNSFQESRCHGLAPLDFTVIASFTSFDL